MCRRCLPWLVVVMLATTCGVFLAEDDSRYPVMRPTADQWMQWQLEIENAPRAFIDPKITAALAQSRALKITSSMDLLAHLDYVPADRNQGSCGNCWAWAGTGVLEVAHSVQDNVFDRLSLQYLNSCYTPYACCGGGLGGFVTWYNGQREVMPWSNTDADFCDGGMRCSDGASTRTCAAIATLPSYGLASIAEVGITTHNIAQTDAIANIKNILNQNRAIYFSFALPEQAAWDDFFDFWDGSGGETETSPWVDVGGYCGTEWSEGTGGAGGHAVLLVGYNDDDADPANHYWLMVNSWGTASGLRPNGFFRVPMQMNYDCWYPDTNNDRSLWAFGFGTIDVQFDNAPPVADADGPYYVPCGGTTTTLQLDATGSSDPEGGPMAYAWETDCPGGSFDDPFAVMPWLTVDTSPGCMVQCTATVTVTDDVGDSDTDFTTVLIEDSDPPEITCPADVIIECDQPTDPSATGMATATDTCDPSPVVDYENWMTPGACPEAYSLTRTWTVDDACANANGCIQTIDVVDTTAPVISCNAPPTITPPDAPISFTATALDNCDGEPTVEIAGYDCYMFTNKGKRISKLESCIVGFSGSTFSIYDSGGVDDHIVWYGSAVDSCGNAQPFTCELLVVNPSP